MKDFFDATWKICVLVLLLLILVAIESAHAEWEVVSFDTTEQLAAISDSITDGTAIITWREVKR